MAAHERHSTARPKAVIYVRVSTKEQVDSNSLDAQTQSCREYCARNGLDVLAIYREEGESAKSAKRTQFQKMIEHVTAKNSGVAAVVVYAMDRFMRNAEEHLVMRALLQRGGVALRSATQPTDDTPMGQFMEGVLALVAKFDNDVRGQRTRDGMRLAAQRGAWMWRPPFGYTRGARGSASLVIDEVRADFVRQAFASVARGETRAAVHQRLVALGLREVSGRPMHAQSFDKMLRNPIYTARVVAPKMNVDTKGDFAPIVSDETFAAAQAAMRRGGRPGARLREHPEFPLRGLLRCARCDTRLTASASKGNGGRYGYYHCRSRSCEGVRMRAENMHDLFVGLLRAVQPKPAYLRLFNEVVLDAWRSRRVSATETRARLTARLDALAEKRDALTDLLVARRIPQDAYESSLRKLDDERTQVRDELALATDETDQIDDVLAFASRALTDSSQLWQRLPTDGKHRFQAAVFPVGLTFDGSSFGTATTSPVFTYLRAIAGGLNGEASPGGVEPP